MQRYMESDPYPNVEEATQAAQCFMDKYGYTIFVSGSVNFPGGVHTSEHEHLPTTIPLCIREPAHLNHKLIKYWSRFYFFVPFDIISKKEVFHFAKKRRI